MQKKKKKKRREWRKREVYCNKSIATQQHREGLPTLLPHVVLKYDDDKQKDRGL